MTIQEYTLAQFESVGALRSGHFVLASGRHSDRYLNKDAIYPHTTKISRLCRKIATHFDDSLMNIEVVVGPEKGGIILAQWVAAALCCWDFEVLAVYAEKAPERDFVFNRGYAQLVVNKRVLVVEDILTTGESVERVVHAVREVGGEVIGVGALCNRGGVTAEQLGVPELKCLCELKLDSWTEADCPMCQADVPVNTEVGKGREFLAAQSAY